MKVKIVNRSKHPLPSYETALSAGMDLRANIEDKPFVTLMPGEHKLINTGIRISLPEGYEAQIRPRSGLALRHGITVVNSPGCVDADYRGEIGVILINHGCEPIFIHDGDRIAQMVIKKFETVEWEECKHLEETQRGENGFGHTGK